MTTARRQMLEILADYPHGASRERLLEDAADLGIPAETAANALRCVVRDGRAGVKELYYPQQLLTTSQLRGVRVFAQHGPLTAKQLAQTSGAHLKAAQNLVRHMREAGLLVEAGTTTPARGPAARTYRLADGVRV